MTKEEIIEMAKEADLVTWLNISQNFSSGVWWIEAHEPDDCLFKFAKLVAQHEREACANVCINIAHKWTRMGAWGTNNEYHECANAIRARVMEKA